MSVAALADMGAKEDICTALGSNGKKLEFALADCTMESNGARTTRFPHATITQKDLMKIVQSIHTTPQNAENNATTRTMASNIRTTCRKPQRFTMFKVKIFKKKFSKTAQLKLRSEFTKTF